MPAASSASSPQTSPVFSSITSSSNIDNNDVWFDASDSLDMDETWFDAVDDLPAAHASIEEKVEAHSIDRRLSTLCHRAH